MGLVGFLHRSIPCLAALHAKVFSKRNTSSLQQCQIRDGGFKVCVDGNGGVLAEFSSGAAGACCRAQWKCVQFLKQEPTKRV